MRKFLVRLLLFLIVAAGAAYLLYPIAIDQYMLYRNAPLLQTYRQLAAGLDADREAGQIKAIADWNNRQLRAGIVPAEEPDMRVSDANETKLNRLAETLRGGTPGKTENVWMEMLSVTNGGVTRRMIARLLERFLRAGGMIQPLEVKDPFTAKRGGESSLMIADRNGVIGILEIPRIGVNLPVYGERSSNQMETGLFYGPGSSLPIGGRGTHALLAGSGGLDAPELLAEIKLTGPKMLEDTELLSKGDLFLFTIMNQTLVYQVERISAAPANQTFILERTISKDLMTIVSATRDGGRLVIRGKRIAPNENEEYILKENAASIPPYWVNIPVLASPVLVFGLLVTLIVECVKHRRYRLPTEKR